jgi:cyclin-dependent kinase 7|uniref:Cyclin-dependent kinase 7 n=1 Tax=Panagrolaimus sp. PS1159 TaxID=55785 RepID=A0AC35FR76_9BILA
MPPQNNKRYEKIKHLGEGQFAHVYQARDTITGDIVAIKKIKLASRKEMEDGIDRSAIREIKLLREIEHENVIWLRDVIGHRKNIQLVMDFMETDLEVLIRNLDVTLTSGHVKNIMLQLLLGLEHLHINWILHRDLKPNNLLMNSAGRLKITDFGLARYFGSPNREYSHMVVTRWYRSPELLFGARGYGTGVDIWAVGCILGELFLRKPVFPGESDIDQLVKIFNVLGTPKEETWPDMKALPSFMEMKADQNYTLRTVFSAASEDSLEFMQSCFEFNPSKRCTATTALQSQYFQKEPFPCHDSELPGVSSVEKLNALKRKPMRELMDEGPNPTRRKLDFDNI